MSKNKNSHVTPLMETLSWFQEAVPSPHQKNLTTQVGVHLEEVCELLETLRPVDSTTDDLIEGAFGSLSKLAKHLKHTDKVAVAVTNRVGVLDSLCDQIVTAVGIGHMAALDVPHALNEVNRSNFSKFENGKPVFQPGGKIGKGKHYSPPNLEPFV